MDSKIIGIAGPTGAGKTLLAEHLSKHYSATWLSLDYFFKSPSKIKTEAGQLNWEHPDNLEWDRFYDVLVKLKSGEDVRYIYHSYYGEHRVEIKNFSAAPIIVVDGFLLFYKKSVRDLIDCKIFLDISERIQLERRMVRNKGDYIDQEYFENFVWPYYRKVILPTMKYADIKIEARQPFNTVFQKTTNFITRYLGI